MCAEMLALWHHEYAQVGGTCSCRCIPAYYQHEDIWSPCLMVGGKGDDISHAPACRF